MRKWQKTTKSRFVVYFHNIKIKQQQQKLKSVYKIVQKHAYIGINEGSAIYSLVTLREINVLTVLEEVILPPYNYNATGGCYFYVWFKKNYHWQSISIQCQAKREWKIKPQLCKLVFLTIIFMFNTECVLYCVVCTACYDNVRMCVLTFLNFMNVITLMSCLWVGTLHKDTRTYLYDHFVYWFLAG